MQKPLYNIPIVFTTRNTPAVRQRLRSYASTPSALQTHAEDLRRILHEMQPGHLVDTENYAMLLLIVSTSLFKTYFVDTF